MGTLITMGDTERTLTKYSINWEAIDAGVQAVNYCTPIKYSIYPGIVYHYISSPVQKVFPSVDNLVALKVPGIYFHPDFFLKVFYNEETEEFEASIIKPKGISAKESTFTVKFMSKRWLDSNQYFGGRFTTNAEYVNIWKVYNLVTREPRVPDISWLNQYVRILNPDDLEMYCTHQTTPTDRLTTLPSSDLNEFHRELDADIDEKENSIYTEYYSTNTNVINTIAHIQREIALGKGKGKGKYGFEKGKGKGYEFNMPRESPINLKLKQVLGSQSYIIDAEGMLHSWYAPDNLSRISVFKSENKSAHLEVINGLIDELQSMKSTFEASIKRDVEESKKAKRPNKPKGIFAVKSKPKAESDEDDKQDSSDRSEPTPVSRGKEKKKKKKSKKKSKKD